jgi:lysophospholipase L1-like esterase
MTRYNLVGASLALSLMAGQALAQNTPPAVSTPADFAPEIARFAEQDAMVPPPPCGFLFVGSSSVRFWRGLGLDMAPYAVINRGFGGAKISDVNFYFDKVVAPYRPRAIFFYAGENDLWAGAKAEDVVGDFQTFMDRKTATLGDTPVYFISLKPSKQRLAQFDLQSQVNGTLKSLARKRSDLNYVDVVAIMRDRGAPKEVFVADGLHMTPEGYALWTKVVRPVLERNVASKQVCPKP